MDEDRRIRFLIPPVLFIASLLWGASWDPGYHELIKTLLVSDTKNDWSKLVGLIGVGIAVGSVLVITAGYIFGTVTYLFLRRFFFCLSQGKFQFHEVALPDHKSKDIWKRLNILNPDPQQLLFAGVAFDHGIVREEHEGVHQWSVRRWSAFNIAANSICALIFSIPFGFVIHIQLTLWVFIWIVPVIILIFMLYRAAVLAWHDTMNMLEFMARLPIKQKQPESPAGNLQ
jgi:hypothetical protein